MIERRCEIRFMLEYECHDKIHDNGTAESEERKVNEVHPHGGGPDAELFAPPLANAERFLFEPAADRVNHQSKIKKTRESQPAATSSHENRRWLCRRRQQCSADGAPQALFLLAVLIGELYQALAAESVAHKMLFLCKQPGFPVQLRCT